MHRRPPAASPFGYLEPSDEALQILSDETGGLKVCRVRLFFANHHESCQNAADEGRPAFLDVSSTLMLAFLRNVGFGGEMRTASHSAIVVGLVLLGSSAAPDRGRAASYSDAARDRQPAASYTEHACGTPAQLSCRSCAVTCPASKLAICKAGMNIWRSSTWSCLFQPTCACQTSIWSLLPERPRQARKTPRHPAHRADAAGE